MPRFKKAVFALPSLFTLSSVFCAFLSISFVFSAQTEAALERLALLNYAAYAILGSIFFDTFDGKVARITKTTSRFGMELDSLADGVSFGVAPAMLIYGFALQNLGLWGIIASFLFMCGALLRLARFNIEAPSEGVQSFFKGIPSPGAAACIVALVLLCIAVDFTSFTRFEINTIAGITVGCGLLMVSNVKYPTYKGKKSKFDYVYIATGLTGFAALLIVFRNFAIAFFALMAYYVLGGMLMSSYDLLRYRPRGNKPHRLRIIHHSKDKLPALSAAQTEHATEPEGTDEHDPSEAHKN